MATKRDLVDRLRDIHATHADASEAADRIEKLENLIVSLKRYLKEGIELHKKGTPLSSMAEDVGVVINYGEILRYIEKKE